MPGPTIDQAFITKFNRDVHLAYQVTEAKFRHLVRQDADVTGDRVRFQKLGTMTVGSKARNGDISIQNPEHTWVEVILLDRYGAVLIDQLDLTKLNIAVREGYIYNMSAAFARETDTQILAAMTAGATENVNSGFSGNLTRNLVLEARAILDNNDVQNNAVAAAVTPQMWAHLMTIPEFANEQYVGYDGQPWKMQGPPMKFWNRANWFVSTLLPGNGTASARGYMWDRRSVGHAIGQEVSITWDWENLKKAWSGAGSMSMNAVVIDAAGLVELRADDTAALPTP